MDRRTPARAVAYAYLLVVSAVVVGLLLVGFLLAGLPGTWARGYEPAMFAAIGWLARPVDGVASRPTDRHRPPARAPGDTTD